MIRLSEVLNVLKISKPTLYRWIEKGCPVHHIGSIPYFDMMEVTEWMKNQRKGE